MTVLFIAFAISLVATMLIVRKAHLHGHISNDHDLDGVQKFHHMPVPRIGGVALAVGLTAVLFYFFLVSFPEQFHFLVLLSFCSMPAFLSGLAEDLTKRVGILMRLGFTMLAAVMAFYLLDGRLVRLDLPGIDYLLTWTPFAVLITAVAVGGIANAINIVDGFNGLASAVSIIMLLALAYVGYKVGDVLVVQAALAMAGALLGFFLLNWPWGLIFLGDGGAYLVGFWIAELSVLLVARNPEVSPWFPLMIVAYPLVETLFSVYRRVVVKKASPGLPDAAHLHQIIFKRLVKWVVGSEDARHLKMRNSMTSPYLWVISSFSVIPALFLWQSSLLLQISFIVFVVFYIVLYQELVRFKAPKWLVLRKADQSHKNVDNRDDYT